MDGVNLNNFETVFDMTCQQNPYFVDQALLNYAGNWMGGVGIDSLDTDCPGSNLDPRDSYSLNYLDAPLYSLDSEHYHDYFH